MKNKIIPTNFDLSENEKKEIKEKKKCYLNSRAASIEALKIVQKKRGWVSLNSIYAIAKLLSLPPVEIEEIATFYNHIYRQPVGRNVIRYCDSMVCYITGYIEIKNELKRILKINIGETTIDNRFTLLPTCCLGCCDKSPAMMINDKTYTKLTVGLIPILLEKHQ
ncbi:NADH-quinone oxidoreductase subunit E [Buchnera aphidicola (Tetraneura ulmi)]|uniref:NADH-quinone oxidoreductase subunit NuoE n=1 Tax=Buchnera aphidicola TaxID=9 RepID=UPI003464D7DF